jgi:hypothetical protein
VGGSNTPQVSWKAIEAGARLVAADGHEIGRIEQVAGDEEADIFNGLVVSLPGEDGDGRYVAAERVQRIWPDHVETDLGLDEAQRLPAYTEPPKSVTWRASEGRRFTDRLRSAFRDLFGRP